MRALTTLLTAPVEGAVSPVQKADALTNAHILLLGLTMVMVVLLVAIGILVGIRLRRRGAERREPRREPEVSAWELAGERADADDESINLGGGSDPNDDTWAGSAP